MTHNRGFCVYGKGLTRQSAKKKKGNAQQLNGTREGAEGKQHKILDSVCKKGLTQKNATKKRNAQILTSFWRKRQRRGKTPRSNWSLCLPWTRPCSQTPKCWKNHDQTQRVNVKAFSFAIFRRSYRATPTPVTPHPHTPLTPTRFDPFLTRFWPEFDPILTLNRPKRSKSGQIQVKIKPKRGQNRVGVSGVWGWGVTGVEAAL